MKIQVPIYKNGTFKEEKEIEVNFPRCIINENLSNERYRYYTYLSENKQIQIRTGIAGEIDITSFTINKARSLGAIYQTTGFDDTQNRIIELDDFKKMLEVERLKITDIIDQL